MITLHVYKIHPLKKEFQIFTEHIFVVFLKFFVFSWLGHSTLFFNQKNDMQIDFHDDPNELRHLEFFFSKP